MRLNIRNLGILEVASSFYSPGADYGSEPVAIQRGIPTAEMNTSQMLSVIVPALVTVGIIS